LGAPLGFAATGLGNDKLSRRWLVAGPAPRSLYSDGVAAICSGLTLAGESAVAVQTVLVRKVNGLDYNLDYEVKISGENPILARRFESGDGAQHQPLK
jgi:hypothetical protein